MILCSGFSKVKKVTTIFHHATMFPLRKRNLDREKDSTIQNIIYLVKKEITRQSVIYMSLNQRKNKANFEK